MNEEDFTLKVEDLEIIKSIIEVCSSRGAIKPEEMQTVGTVYKKLSGFLELMQVPASTDESDPSEDPTTTKE